MSDNKPSGTGSTPATGSTSASSTSTTSTRRTDETYDPNDAFCIYCQKQFKSCNNLRRHVLRKHEHTYAYYSVLEGRI